MSTDPTDRDAVRHLLHTINSAWAHGDPLDLPATLHDCFDQAVVFCSPSLERLADGRQAAIASYADFLQQATLEQATLDEPVIDIWGTTAVASYAWQVRYQFDGQVHHDVGHDVFVFSRDHQNRWRATWRMMLPGQPS
jgi:hypothetical protein